MNFDFIPFLEVEILVGNITPPSSPVCILYIRKNKHAGGVMDG